MGHTFRKEKSDDFRKSHKKVMVQEIERKQAKNKNFSQYYEEEFEEDEFEDDNYFDDSLEYEEENNNFTKIKK
jgi:hypothetical protein